MNLLHDKAFDRGLMTITQNYEIKFSGKLIKSIKDTPSERFFLPYENRSITLPQRFLPGKEYLKHHNENIFMDAF
jgi:putative restriction endonuclease